MGDKILGMAIVEEVQVYIDWAEVEDMRWESNHFSYGCSWSGYYHVGVDVLVDCMRDYFDMRDYVLVPPTELAFRGTEFVRSVNLPENDSVHDAVRGVVRGVVHGVVHDVVHDAVHDAVHGVVHDAHDVAPWFRVWNQMERKSPFL